MRYKSSCEKVLNIIGAGEYKVVCPKDLDEGTYCIEYGTSLEVAQVNGSPYGWFVGGIPILNKETDHGIFINNSKELFDTLETSSFWQGEIHEIT